MKLVIVACLVALCTAIPPTPKIPNTFCASGEAEHHVADRTLFGEFLLCRDQAKQMEVIQIQYKETKDTEARLLRYDMSPKHMAYFVRGKEGGERCIKDERNVTSKLPEFFEWINAATYEGEKKVREYTYDMWGLTVADMRLEILASKEKPNEPAIYNRRESEDFMLYTYKSFSASTPDPSVFDIPKQCMQ